MTPFLKDIAGWMIRNFSGDLSDISIVFPNKRAGLFFRHYLSSMIEKPVWSPVITDISTFIASFHNLQIPDKFTLNFELYEAFRLICVKNNIEADAIEKFYPWGNMIIKDFNEIDKNLVNAENLFTTVIELKNIDSLFDYLSEEQIETLKSFWGNIINSRSSEHKQKFMELWQILPELYKVYHENLKSKNLAYEGMLYRETVSKSEQGQLELSTETIIFAGFNVLNKAENELFKFFKTKKKGYFLWDIADFYLQKENFSIASEIKKNIEYFAPPKDFNPSDCLPLENKKIEIIGVPLEAGQAKLAGQLLLAIPQRKQINNEKIIDQTAIVLSSEHLMLPVIGSIPAHLDDINITMGYPLKSSVISALIQSLSALHQNSKVSSNESIVYYFKDVQKLLKNAYIYQQNPESIDNFLARVIEKNSIYISRNQLIGLFELAPALFSKIPEGKEVFNYFIDLLFSLFNLAETNQIQNELVLAFYKELTQLKNVFTEYNYEFPSKLVFSFLNEIINSIKVPFVGEPLGSLQMMGILETRCLDFDNLIILSMNEGIWPASTHGHSFIPYNLRKTFELSTPELEDKIFGYYFYRLIQRATNIYLIYNTEAGYNGSEEMSRYLSQLKYDFKLNLKEGVLSQPILSFPQKEIVIEKTEFIIDRLNSYLEGSKENRSFTASALNTYLDCKLKFYFMYLAKISEIKEVNEEMDERLFGNILHKTMEMLYNNLIENKNDQIVYPENLKIKNEIIEEIVKTAFREELNISGNETTINEGFNLIIQQVISKYARKILDNDLKYAPFEIISLEKSGGWYGNSIKLIIGDQTQKVKLTGIIDRIDKKDEVIRVIDYKTGITELTFGAVSSLFERENAKRNKSAFQALFYGFLISNEEFINGCKITPGIYKLRDLKSGWKLSIKNRQEEVVIENFNQVKTEFLTHLGNLLTDILDSNYPFSQTNDLLKCNNCPYKGICSR